MAQGSEHSSLEVEGKLDDSQILCSLEVEVEEEECLRTAQLLPNLRAVGINQICLC